MVAGLSVGQADPPIVPFAPGGNVDITARTIAPGLGEAIGQTVMVENRTGAGGVLGADAVAKSPADGYTLLMGSNSSVSVAPALNPKNPYHPIRDFAPIVAGRRDAVRAGRAPVGAGQDARAN